MWTGTPDPATRRATATPSAMVRATGFSQNTGTPASAAATMSSGWASVTTREVTDGNADSVSAWKAPIRPSPINPILMATPVLMTTERSFPAADYGVIRGDVGDQGVVRRCASRAAAGSCVARAAGTTPVDGPGAVHGGHSGLSARPPLPPLQTPRRWQSRP